MGQNGYTIARFKAKVQKRYYFIRYRFSRIAAFIKRLPFIRGFKRRHYIGAGLLSIVGVLLVAWLLVPPVKAATYNIGSDDLMKGTADFNQIQLANNNNALSLQKGDIGKWFDGDDAQQPPMLIGDDSNLVAGPNNMLYLLTGLDSCRLLRFSTETQKWDETTAPPIGCGSGSNLVYDGVGAMYYLPGGNENAFFRYDIDSDTWTKLADMGAQVGARATAVFVGSGNNAAIYLMRGALTGSFWQYSVQSNTWTSKAIFPNTGHIGSGISIAWDGGNNIYAIANLGSEFKRYSIASNAWSNLAMPENGTRLNRLMWVNGEIYNVQVKIYNSPDPDSSWMVKYNPTSNTWSSLPRPPMGTYYDYPVVATYDGNDSVYAMLGSYQHTGLYRYSISQGKWLGSSLFQTQDQALNHYELMYDGSQSAYFIGGRDSGTVDRVYKYDLPTKTVTQVGGQFNSTNGTNGVYYNGFLYTMPLYGSSVAFHKYDTNAHNWTQLADMPYGVGEGADIINGGDGFLYAVFGARADFFRYSEAGGWVRLANMPASISAGGGITRIGRTIYAQSGGTTSGFYRYNMDTNTWTSAGDMPSGGVYYNGWLTGDGSRYLYANLSTWTDPQARRIYRFDTTNSTWARMADMPETSQLRGDAFYDTAANRLYVMRGMSFSDIYYWTPTANSYATSGTWYSKTIDLKGPQSWQSLSSTVTGSGSVTLYTRTSSKGGLWSNWQQVSGTNVTSPLRRYVQIKAVLTGNGSSTPTLSNIALSYGEDVTAPTLPSQLTAQGVAGGQNLTSGQTYQYQHPYFSWSGSSDGTVGTGLAGYHVYFGTDSGADPAVDGNFQTTSNYTVTTAMNAGGVYYLRIKAKDNAGNTSDAATYFTYRYFYISPPGSLLYTNKSDFSQGTNIGVSLGDDGSMSLPQQANGAWATGTMQPLPNSTYGPAATVISDHLYVLRGNGTADFWRYDLVSQVWDNMLSAPATATSGSSLTWDKGNFIYMVRGGGTSGFYRYNIQNNAWETLPNLPAFAQAGTDITFIGNNKIAIQFSGTTEFYMYNITNSIFESKTNAPVLQSSGNAGGGMWYDGNDTLYAYFGAYDQWQDNRTSLMAYSISQDSWRPLARPSMNATYPENNLVGDGNGNLYIFANDYVSNQSNKAMAARYNIASDTWSLLPNSTTPNIRGTATSDGKRYIYMIPSTTGGSNSRRIVQYDTWDNRFLPQDTKGIPSWHRVEWNMQNEWNWLAGSSTTAIYDGTDNMYALGASEGNWGRFIRYSVSKGETEYLTPPPNFGIGGSLAYLNGKLYYMPARNTTSFYNFDFATESWVRMANVPSVVLRPGTNSLQVIGSAIYAFAGNGRIMYKFTPDSGSGSWTRMADSPGLIYQGSMTNDGNNFIYVAPGNNANALYRYDVSANTWSTLATAPGPINAGAAAYKNGKIYLAAGNTTRNTYVYDVAANSWQAGPAAPDNFTFGSVYVPINDEYAFVIASSGSTPDIWRFNFAGTNAAYNGLATHISQPMMVDGIFDYAGIKAQASIPDGTKVEFFTRTSADGVNWNEWKITDNAKYYANEMVTKVTSTPQDYVQIKAVLYSFNNQSTPKIDSYALDYYYDTTPPNNPTLLSTHGDSTKQTTLSSNVWYNDDTPFFDWPDPGEVGGATDGPLGSNIKGYWVYVGTDPTAQPQTAGVFVTSSQYSPTLTTSGTYYVRLQAVDITGNVDGAVFAPFIYKFDNVPPTAPALITVTPSGFTSINKYTFQWPNSFDANSGVDTYCYHTGALSGPFANEICQTGLELKDLSAAYRPGTNVFYLRTKDVAGNYSSSYTTVSYYFSTDPPSPVTSLRAVPPVSAQNLFAFTWDLPALFAGDPDQLSYCYAVNELPSPTNTTCTTDKFIGAFKAATQQGTNILYMVAKDEAGNVNWNNYASTNFIANTVSPGIPLNLVVSDNSDRLSGRWALTLTWDKPTFEGNGITHYVIERSEDNHTYTEIGQVSNTAYVDLTVQPEVKYFYRIRAGDNVDNRGGPSGVSAGTAKGNFTTPPQIVAEPKVQPSFDQATISWVTARASTSFVYYGTSPTQLTQSKGSLDLVSEHSVTITGLQPSTNYYFKVQSFDNDRGYDLSQAYSQFYTFKTSANARIFNVTATDLTLDSAIINWQTSVPTKARIQYGLGTDYGFTQDDAAGASTNHIFKLTGLTSGTTYHYRIVATTDYGSQVTSDDYTLRTIARPVISNVKFQPLPDDLSIAVKVSWTTNVPTSSDVTYRGLGTQKKQSASDLVTEHEMIITDMAGNTEYSFDIQGRDQYGNLASSDNQLWKTSVDTRPPAISNLSVNVSTMDTANNKAQLIISWKTDEPSTTQLQYGDGSAKRLTKKTSLDPEPTVNHVVVVSGLDLAKVYKIQPVSRDISGNTTYGGQLATVTPDKEQSPLDAVLNTLQRIFRF